MPKISLKKDERVVREVRRHGITFFWSWLLIALLFGTPFFFMFWLFQQGWWGQALFFIPITIGTMLLFRIIFVLYKNVTMLTTHRIIDIDQRGFFDKHISDIPYDQIEDVSGRIKGVGGTLFRYGDVIIDTGNAKMEILLNRVSHPTQIQHEIGELRDQYLSRYAHDFSDNVADVIIEKLHELTMPELFRVKKKLRSLLEKEKQKNA